MHDLKEEIDKINKLGYSRKRLTCDSPQDVTVSINKKKHISFASNDYLGLANNLDIKKWPISARPHVKKGGHYVYFRTNFNNSSFFTNKNFKTQLGREIVYEIEIQTNPKFKNLTEEILKKNTYANIWQWQNYSFSENMLKTMNDLIPAVEKIKSGANSNKFNFKTFKKK